MMGMRNYTILLFRQFSLSIFSRAHFFNNLEEAVHDIPNNSKLLIGGYGVCGVPHSLITAVGKRGSVNLTIVSNNPGMENFGVEFLLQKKQVKRVVLSFSLSKEFLRQYLSGELEVEFVPQGTLSERIRAGGAGIPAFYTPTGYGTVVEEGGVPKKFNSDRSICLASELKKVKVFNGRKFVLEEAITGDFSLIKAWKADKYGNLIFRKSTPNFNIPMCKAAKVTIAEVDEIVEIGEIPLENVHVPSIYVQRVVIGDKFEKEIKRLIQFKKNDDGAIITSAEKRREIITRRAALELKDNVYANLGNGMPVLVRNYIPSIITVHIHSENGVLEMGHYPLENELDTDLSSASLLPATALPRASFFASDESFAMIRGGHLQITLLGGMQVSRFGDLANWIVPRTLVKGMGGAMDLVASDMKVVVTMEHTAKDGTPKILETCFLPLTGKNCVDRIITEKGVFDVNKETGLTLVEIADGVNIEEIRSCTACQFEVSQEIKPMGQI